MTSRERVVAAMKLEGHDQVPVMCQFSFGFINQQLKGSDISPMQLWLDAEKYAEGLLILRERFNFDGILVSIHGHFKNWRERIKKVEIMDGLEVAIYDDRKEIYVDDDLPVGKFNKSRKKDIESLDPDDIPELLDYMPASKDCYTFIDNNDPYRVFRILEQTLGNEYSIHGEVTSPLDYLLDYIGYQEALLAMIMYPEKVKQVLEKFAKGVIRMAEDMAQNNDIDAIKISSPFAGMDFISPEHYRDYELPYLKKIASAIKAKGKSVYVHTCGHIDDRLELMAESGVSGLECLDPPPIGNVELGNAFERIGGHMFIKGNIDSVNTLLYGNKELVANEVEQRLKIGKQYPGFILSTACSIAPKVPAAHIKMLSELVQKHGKY